MRKIAVLTSGGDAPGMNAAIRAVVRAGIYYGFEVYGVQQGYQGLMDDNIVKLDAYSVSDKIQRGGTFLRSARCLEMKTDEGLKRAVDTLNRHEIEGLVVIGGDGSYRGAQKLSRAGINVIGIPGTIDNDISCTEYSIGFDTAVNTAVDAINKIRDTSSSHSRVNVVEVMGRNSGFIALYAGIAAGAEAILIPEKELNLDVVCEKIKEGFSLGKYYGLVILAEGVGHYEEFCDVIEKYSGVTTRGTNLGYIQRGGSPTAFDRMLASKMGALAVECLRDGKTNRCMCYQHGRFLDMEIEEALAMPYVIDEEAKRIAEMLAI
ncbi:MULTISPECIES: 6-phosphofructokinase [Anaerofustis]|uniref:6-phosphofructokinase n=1 Tax=Anaerofustis TaxID=264995 RepID=UPI001105EE4F|nr:MULTISPECIES: 6-phosphofructokinase [Anaerofustis]MCO8194710.1 6-phosphofructokinase [Anaerofustis sp. NSJ-163]